MSKKQKLVLTIGLSVLVIFGGLTLGIYNYKEHTVNNLINTGIEYINNKEYDKAIATLDIVLQNSKNERALELKNLVNNYLDANSSYEKHNLDTAIKDLDNMKDYSQYKGLNEDINSLKTKIELDLKKEKDMDDAIINVKNLIHDGKYSDAKNAINKLDKKDMSDSQKKEVDDLTSKVNTEIEKQESEKKAQEEANKKQEVKQNEIPVSQSPVFGEKTPWSKDGYTSYKGIRLPLPNGDPMQISGKLLDQICKLPMNEAFQILKNYGWSDREATRVIHECQNDN